MQIPKFPCFVTDVLNQLIDEDSTLSIWFIGSRANGSDRPDSDWDFIVFTNHDVQERSARHEKIDIIQVSRTHNNYLLEGKEINMCEKFSTWKWVTLQSDLAQYTIRKTPQVEIGEAFDSIDVEYIKLNGIKIWERNV